MALRIIDGNDSDALVIVREHLMHVRHEMKAERESGIDMTTSLACYAMLTEIEQELTERIDATNQNRSASASEIKGATITPDADVIAALLEA